MVAAETYQAKFFDGESARQHEATISLGEQYGSAFLLVEVPDRKPVIWPLDDMREVHDQARAEGIVLKHGQNGIERLIIAEDVVATRMREVCPNLKKRKVAPALTRKLLFWTAAAAASICIIMFVILPNLSNQLARLIPIEREVAIGRTALDQIGKILTRGDKSLTCSSPAGDAALAKMTARLTANLDNPYELKVQVFDHPALNAFAVPGGHVVLFKGLLKAADQPEEVAGVLGHEIGHVINRDPTRLTLRSAGSIGILGLVFGDFAGGALALILAERLISAQYAQGAEADADVVAHELLTNAGLPTKPFAGFFLKLKSQFGDSKGLMSHLASHPDLDGRAAAATAADALGSAAFKPVLNDAEWAALQSICG